MAQWPYGNQSMPGLDFFHLFSSHAMTCRLPICLLYNCVGPSSINFTTRVQLSGLGAREYKYESFIGCHQYFNFEKPSIFYIDSPEIHRNDLCFPSLFLFSLF